MNKCHKHHVVVEYEDYCVLCERSRKRRNKWLIWSTVAFGLAGLVIIFVYSLFID